MAQDRMANDMVQKLNPLPDDDDDEFGSDMEDDDLVADDDENDDESPFYERAD